MIVSRELLLMILIQVVVLSEQEGGSCEVMVQKNPMGKPVLYRGVCKNKTNPECPEIKIGRYVCEQRCTSYFYEAIGLGIAAGLLFVTLGVVIIGWVFTCWLMHKTTDFSVRPKESIRLNRYEETPSESSTSFQPLTTYSQFGPSYENTDGRGMSVEGEGIYEVLDGEEEKPNMKRSFGKDRNVVISGGHKDSYNTLKYEEHH